MRKRYLAIWSAIFIFGGTVLACPLGAQETQPTPPVSVPAPSFTVSGNVQKPLTYTTTELQKTFPDAVQTVSYTLKGKKETAHAVSLLTLIRAALPPADPKSKRKNPLLALSIVVTGADGYCVTFSGGELLPEIGKRDVFLALDKNNAPLPPTEAPVRLLVPGDIKPSRWLFGVRSIRIVDAGQFRTGEPAMLVPAPAADK